MITFHIISLFPEVFDPYFSASIIGRAQDKKIIKIKTYNPRDFTTDKYRKVDNKSYGGGPGMVLMIEPILKAFTSIFNKNNRQAKVIIFSAAGKQFNKETAIKWAGKYKNIIFICGHYEVIDARLKNILKSMKIDVEEISIGPYILSGGEAAAMVAIDAISRHIQGVLGKIGSLEEKKGSYPAYTRPEIFIFKGRKYRVPKVLLSGDHKKISAWRKKCGKMD